MIKILANDGIDAAGKKYLIQQDFQFLQIKYLRKNLRKH